MTACVRPPRAQTHKPSEAVKLRHARGLVEFEIGSCRGGAVVSDAEGRIVGWEGRGTLAVDGKPWLAAEDDLLLYSVDRANLAAKRGVNGVRAAWSDLESRGIILIGTEQGLAAAADSVVADLRR